MANISLKKHSLEEVVSFLNDVRATGFINQTVFESIGEQLKIQTEKRFEQQIDPDGNPWQPLNAKYQTHKATTAEINKILQFSGKLLDKLASQATDYSVKFGSNRIYANTHQYGSANGVIPARPFLGINDEDKKIIAEELQDAWELWLSEKS